MPVNAAINRANTPNPINAGPAAAPTATATSIAALIANRTAPIATAAANIPSTGCVDRKYKDAAIPRTPTTPTAKATIAPRFGLNADIRLIAPAIAITTAEIATPAANIPAQG